jgi:hypothetical protein
LVTQRLNFSIDLVFAFGQFCDVRSQAFNSGALTGTFLAGAFAAGFAAFAGAFMGAVDFFGAAFEAAFFAVAILNFPF